MNESISGIYLWLGMPHQFSYIFYSQSDETSNDTFSKIRLTYEIVYVLAFVSSVNSVALILLRYYIARIFTTDV